MSNLTKKAIKLAFIELVSEKPLSQISVRMIVEKCGINRNSFYYHFQDIPAMIDEIITEAFNSIIAKYPSITSLSDCFNEAFKYTLKYKKMFLHIWNSMNREYLEENLIRLCDYAVSSYLHTAFKSEISEKDREIVKRVLTYELFGACIHWLSSGMPEDSVDNINRAFEILQGLSDEIIQRCNKDKNQ